VLRKGFVVYVTHRPNEPTVGVTEEGTGRFLPWVYEFQSGEGIGGSARMRSVPSSPSVATDSASAVRVALEFIEHLFGRGSQQNVVHCVEDVQTGWLVTMVPGDAVIAPSGPVEGWVVGVSREEGTFLIARF
jgi:hypothetical protein